MTTTHDYDHATGESVIGSHQDVSVVLEVNKILQNSDTYSKKGIKNSWWHYASLPMVLIEKWKNEHGIDVFNKDHNKAVLKKINDPEYRYLKTTLKMHRG